MARSNSGSSTSWGSVGSAVLTAPPILIAVRVLINNSSNFYNLIGLANNDATQYHFVAASGGGSPSFRLFTQDGSGEVGAIASANYTTGVWYVVGAIILSATERYIEVDGANEGSNSSNRTPTLSRTFVGALRDESGGNTFGAIDGKLAEPAFWDLSAYSGTAAGQKAAALDILRGMTAGHSPEFWPLGRKAFWHLWGNNAPEPDVQGTFDLTINGAALVKNDHPANVAYPAGNGAAGGAPATARAPYYYLLAGGGRV